MLYIAVDGKVDSKSQGPQFNIINKPHTFYGVKNRKRQISIGRAPAVISRDFAKPVGRSPSDRVV